MKFEDFNLSNELLAAIKNAGITEPTQIQEKTIPFVMQGKDVLGESATGSGKTLAFGSGILETVKKGEGLQSLILTPTRELAEQVKNALKEFSYHKHIKISAIYGGVSIQPQYRDLKNSEVIVATPGRLLDHLQQRTIDTSKIKIFVLDEADRMFDMGFIEDVEKIIGQCPKKRQTLFFSATLSERIRKLANRYMDNPAFVSVQKQVDPKKLKQSYYDVQRQLKLSLLVHLLQNEKSDLVMVFCNTRRNVDFIAKNLKANGINAIAIHGGLTQNKRTNSMDSFNKGKTNVLVCTDVAARGLHIDHVSHVYNYDIPKDATDYVHRIGRTARAGEYGKVINILADVDHDNFSRVLSSYRSFIVEKKQVPNIKRIFAKKEEIQRRPHQRVMNRGMNRNSNRGRRFR